MKDSQNDKYHCQIIVLYILGGAALGACLCFGILYVETPFTKLVTDFYTGLLAYAPWITMPIGLAAILFSYVPLAKAKKRIADWNGWNDDTDDTFYRQTEHAPRAAPPRIYRKNRIVIFFLFVSFIFLRRNGF